MERVQGVLVDYFFSLILEPTNVNDKRQGLGILRIW